MSKPGWESATLDDIADVRAGDGFPPERQGRSDGDIPFFKVGDISTTVQLGESTLMRSRNYVSHGDVDELKLHVMPPGTVLFAKIGAAIALNRRGIAGVPMIVDNNVMGVVPCEAVDPRFIYWLMRTIRLETLAQATTVPSIRKSDVLQIPVALPPRNEQRRIVAKLDEIFAQTRAARARLERLPALIEKLKRSILAAAFRGDLTKDWRAANPDVEPASALLDRIRAERRRRVDAATPKGTHHSALPDSWCWARVDEVSDLQLGQQRAPIHAEAEKTLPYVRAANITWSGLDLSDVKRMGFPDPSRYELRYGDVLLSEASGSASEVGKPAIWRDEIPGCCYQKTLLRARPASAAASSEWLHLTFLGDALLGRFAAMAPGVGILHLTAERMFSWPVPIAPAAEQSEIIARATDALAAADKLMASASATDSNLQQIESAVLAKAFRGELVPQDPTDEPASVLLDRIRAERAATDAPVRRPRTAAPAPPSAPPPVATTEPPALDLVIAALQASDARLTAATIADSTGLPPAAVRLALKELVAAGQVRTHGKARGTMYEWIAR